MQLFTQCRKFKVNRDTIDLDSLQVHLGSIGIDLRSCVTSSIMFVFSCMEVPLRDLLHRYVFDMECIAT